jgi:murein DD-endopeptidase MepM/ murein hydrolase activator NlpD
MSKIKKGIKKGVYVKQGDIIGYVGSTGLATGPHVCYRFCKNGKQVDPYKQKLPPGDPISKKNKNEYMFVKDSLMNILNSNI